MSTGIYISDFLLPHMGGQLVSSRVLRESAPLLVFFWAPWDPESVRLFRTIESIHDRYADRFHIVSISIDVLHMYDSMNIIREIKPSFMTLFDGCCVSHRLYHVHDVPSVLLIQQGGQVIRRERDFESIQPHLEDDISSDVSLDHQISDEGYRNMMHAERNLQDCINFIGRNRIDDALSRMEDAAKLFPDISVITRQLAHVRSRLQPV